MRVHEFVEGNKPVIVLVHGVLTPWQIWKPHIDAFKDKYDIYVVALSGHTEDCADEFLSVIDEDEKIIEYFKAKNIDTIDALCGISLGGKISHEIWKKDKIRIRNLVLDGAPLVSCPKFAINFMVKNYKNIIKKSKDRDEKTLEDCKKYCVPEQYVGDYLRIADTITDSSIENIVKSVFYGGEFDNVDNKSRILFLHGTKGNEILSKKAAKLMKKFYPETEVVCFKGDSHCYKAIYTPEKWIDVVKDFLFDGKKKETTI